MELDNYTYLSYDKNLDIKIINKNFIVIGIVVNIDDSLSNIELESKREEINIENIIQYTEKWSGRWVLIFKNFIIGDPLNSLNVFYGNKDQGKYFSNSLGLLYDLGFKVNCDTYEPSKVDSINWNIAPYTRLLGINLLLPFEIINIIDFQKIHHLRFLKCQNQPILKELECYLFKTYQNYSKLNYQIKLALTAGYDSRYLFAGLYTSAVKFKTIIFYYSNIKKSDYIIGKKISSNFKIIHQIIRHTIFGKFLSSYRRKKLIDAYDRGNCQEIDRKWFVQGLYNIKTDEIIFRGNIGTEVFQGNKNYLYYPKGDGTFNSIINSLKVKYPSIKKEQVDDLEKWWNYRITFIEKFDLDWRLIFWLDQRCCAWSGAINSVFDLSNYKAINPLNSDWALGWLYLYTNRGNVNNGYQVNLIDSLLPELNKYPYNPKRNSLLTSFKKLILKKY
jgi:hypothetical protein